MDTDDLEPVRKQPQKRDLEPMSIAALHEYIAELETEIARVRAAIADKEGVRGSAEALFKR